jgi:D-beta-D-heptose 7-phosphate kinase/D-beta-D-heptose 1-phosphate adenosyltransferase
VKAPNILVVGDLMVDHYLYGDVDRVSPEAPVQVVDIKSEELLMGGAGNVINNLLGLGARVGVCSVIGDDSGGEFLQRRLGEKGVVKEGLTIQKDRRTSKKSRIISSHQQILRVDREDKCDISKKSEELILVRASIILEFYDLVIISDYGKGVMSDTLTSGIIELANSKKIPILVDPKGSDYSKYKRATLITPNKKEAELAVGFAINDNKTLKEALKILKDTLDLNYSIITLSEDGIAMLEDEVITIPTVAKDVFDVTGAGDTVIAAIAVSLVQNRPIIDALEYANRAAAVAVSHVGCYAVQASDIASDIPIKKIVSLDELTNSLKRDKKVVFTNGCFDILHSGHVRYLKEAKSFGDILIIGLNGDDSIKRLKGNSRPINGFNDRAEVLASLDMVDFIVKFDSDTPYDLIKTIKPDILVKGGDYKDKEVVGSDLCKELRLVDFVDGKSTTDIIKRARES